MSMGPQSLFTLAQRRRPRDHTAQHFVAKKTTTIKASILGEAKHVLYGTDSTHLVEGPELLRSEPPSELRGRVTPESLTNDLQLLLGRDRLRLGQDREGGGSNCREKKQIINHRVRSGGSNSFRERKKCARVEERRSRVFALSFR